MNHYPASILTGGAEGALDAIDGAILRDGDHAYVPVAGGGFYVYTLNAYLGASESYPMIIVPDNNAGYKCWVLSGMASTSGAGHPTITPVCVGQRYVDTTNKRMWESVGSASSDDWRPVTSGYKDHGDVNSDLTIYAWDASYHRIKVTGAFSLTIAGWLPSGVLDSLTIELIDGSGSVVTWVVIPKTAGGSGFSLTASGTDIIEMTTSDNGATQHGFQAAEDIK